MASSYPAPAVDGREGKDRYDVTRPCPLGPSQCSHRQSVPAACTVSQRTDDQQDPEVQ